MSKSRRRRSRAKGVAAARAVRAELLRQARARGLTWGQIVCRYGGDRANACHQVKRHFGQAGCERGPR